MAILKVARLGHPVLRAAARPVTAAELRSGEVQRLIDDMIETVHEYEGVGLAAPQVHVGLRLAIVQVPESEEGKGDGLPLTILVNPMVTPLGTETELGWEGCLSLPDLRGQVPRSARVRLTALDRKGRSFSLDAAAFPARAIQHECDHLDGIVFVDRMKDLSSLSFLAEFRRYAEEPETGEAQA